MTKKIVKRFIGMAVAGLMLTGLFVYLVDPFYHYHKPLFGMEPYLYNTVYQTPGVARNLEYDSVILGTSMTENFRTSWFDGELGWKTAKLSYSGATTNDIAAIMEEIFSSDREVKHVILDINDYQLMGESDAVFTERPEYLYDRNPFNDVQYLLNKDVIIASCGRVIATVSGAPGNMDLAYCWDEPELFGMKQVEKAFYSHRWQWNTSENVQDKEQQIAESVEKSIKNIENIQCFIEENPGTQFYIFYPPYSMAYWQRLKEDERLEEMLKVYGASMEKLMKYENVSVYYFQDEIDFTSDLNNYRDLCHYSPEMNRYIFECVKEDSHRIDESNYQEKLDAMYQLAAGYDYESLWN